MGHDLAGDAADLTGSSHTVPGLFPTVDAEPALFELPDEPVIMTFLNNSSAKLRTPSHNDHVSTSISRAVLIGWHFFAASFTERAPRVILLQPC